MANVELRFGTPRHRQILQAILDRRDFSKRYFQVGREDEWREADNMHTAYLHETEADKLRRSQRDAGKPQYTTLTIPYSYAIMMTAHTYWTSVFLARSPVFQFTARHGEPQQRVIALEALIDYQKSVGRHMVPYHNWLLDTGKYGFGVLGYHWRNETKLVGEIVEEQVEFNGVPLIGEKRKRKVTREVPGYEGSSVFNIRPWNFHPDPRVTLANLQEGEFAGRTTSTGWHEIIEGAEKGIYFNVDALKRHIADRRKNRWAETPQDVGTRSEPTDQDMSDSEGIPAPEFVDLLEMVVRVVPKDWGLGKSKRPEKWVFTVANDAVLIGVQPLGEMHDHFPFVVLEFEPGAYALTKRSLYEIIRPLQETLDWLVNTHFFNIRQVLNHSLIYDPSRVVQKDLFRGGPGLLVRTTPGMMGQDVRTAVHQLQVNDVTQTHMQDTELVAQMMQRVSGVNDNIMGMVNPGGRKSATEVRSSNALAVNRQKMQTEFFSEMGWSPLAQDLVAMTQQHFRAERQFRIAGTLIGNEQPFIDVDPETIAGQFDFVPVDGTFPIDRFAQVNMWVQMLQQARQFPELLQGYDMAKIFGWILQLGGIKNIDQFRINVTPDEAAANGAQAGNLVPMGGGNAPSSASTVRSQRGGVAGRPSGEERSREPSRVAGMGPAS